MEMRWVGILLRWVAGIVDKASILEESFLPPYSLRGLPPCSVTPLEIVFVPQGTATRSHEVHCINSQHDLVESRVFLGGGAKRMTHHPAEGEDAQKDNYHQKCSD